MTKDATKLSVSEETNNGEVTKQNNAVVSAEVSAATNVNNGHIEADVPLTATDEVKTKEPPLSAREIKMNSITEKRNAERFEQGTVPVVTNEALGLPDDDKGDEVRLKVNGKEKTVSADKVMDAGIRAMQKESNADVKLEEAVNKERSVNARMDELTMREQRIAQREIEIEAGKIAGENTMPSDNTDVSASQGMSDDEADSLVNDLYSGDTEKAREAVKALNQRGQEQSATTQQHEPVTAQEVAAVMREQNDANNVLTKFETTFPEIKKDLNLQNIVNNESLRIRHEHPEYSQEELLMESGKYVAEKYGSKIVDSSGFSDKRERKANTDTVMGADAVRRSQPEVAVQTRQEVVNQMKSGRR